MDKIVEAVSSFLFKEDGTNAFVILDGASVPDLLGKLHGPDSPEFECLYSGELKPDLAEVAPYLVRLEPGSEFTLWVLEQGWGNHWGIFALSAADLRELRRHFRRFLTVYDPSGKPLLFRYYDPRVLRTYLPTCNPEELSTLFGPVSCYLLEGEKPEEMLRFQLASGSLVRQEKQLAAKEA
jgi:hypothetical protein